MKRLAWIVIGGLAFATLGLYCGARVASEVSYALGSL